MIKGSSQKN